MFKSSTEEPEEPDPGRAESAADNADHRVPGTPGVSENQQVGSGYHSGQWLPVGKNQQPREKDMPETPRQFARCLTMMVEDRNADVETDRKLGAQLSDKENAISSLKRDVSLEMEWKTSLQAKQEKIVEEILKMVLQMVLEEVKGQVEVMMRGAVQQEIERLKTKNERDLQALQAIYHSLNELEQQRPSEVTHRLERLRKKDQKSETLKRDLKRIPELEKEKRFEKTILQGSLHKILLQEAAQCIRIQPWDDEPDHIVEIDFPEMAVLGERQLGIEIMKTKDLKFESKTLLTDVIQITQSSHASFLRPVTVRIPLHQKFKNWESTERTDKYGRKIKIENGIAQITSFVFSPAGLYYDEIEQAVHALVLGDRIDQMLHRGRVYMIVEQEINIESPALKISLKPFFSFQEHEKCRVAKNVFFCPCPVAAESFDIVVNLEWDENFITSVNRNLEKDLTFPIGLLPEHQWWTVHILRYKFQEGRIHDTNLTVRFDHFERIVPLLNMADLQDLRESAERFIPSRRDLYLCLNSIPESYGWLNFMQDCLGIDKMNFREFVYKDVLDTNRNRDPNLDEADIETTFERHMQNLTIERFKSEVFSVSSDRLTNDNLVQLAEALRYVDGRRLREALQKGLETLSINLNGTSRKFREWVGDGDGGTEFRRADSTPSLPTLQ